MKIKRLIPSLALLFFILSLSSCGQRQKSPGGQKSQETEQDQKGYIVFINVDSPGKAVMYSMGASGGKNQKKKKLFDKNPDSPSGHESKIAFLAEGKNKKNLYTINADGSSLTTVISGADVKKNSLSWSDDGKRLAFISKMTGDTTEQVYVVDAGSSSTPMNVTNSDVNKESPAFSVDGKSVFYSGVKDKNSDIYRADIALQSENNLSGNAADDISPVSMPDGTRLLFLSDESSKGKFNLYMMNIDGKNRAALTKDLNIERDSIRISPDGSKVSFITVDDSGSKSVKIISISGSTVMISNDSYLSAWSEDGSKLYFASSDPKNRRIVEYDTESGKMKDTVKIEYKPGEEASGIKFLHFTEKSK